MDHVPSQSPSGLTASPVKVRSVPLSPPIVVRFLGPLRGFLTHYNGKRSVPCDGPGKCPTAVHKYGVIFKAYAPALEWIFHLSRWRPVALELTANLEEYLRGRTLRGEEWSLSRPEAKKKTCPVSAAYHSTLADKQLPPAFDVLPILQRLYNRQDLDLEAINPSPRRVVMSEIEAPPPNLPADLQPPPPVPEDPKAREYLAEQYAEMRKMVGRCNSTPSPGGEQRQKASTNGTNGHF